jgi:sporulation protein YlmC with PRC-barrel domain
MIRFLSSTAVALALSISAGALAQTATSAGSITQQQAGEYLADDMIGASVRNAQNENIGSVSDIVIDGEGRVKAMVVSVGGFLGIGDKHVAIPWNDVHVQTKSGTTGSTAAGAAEALRNPMLTVNMTKDQLKQAPEFKTISQQQREMNRSTTTPGTTPGTRTAPSQ